MNEEEFYKKYKKIGEVEIYDSVEEVDENKSGSSFIVVDQELFDEKWESNQK